MYYAHFGLKEPPFKITPNTDFFYTGGNRGVILDALIYAIRNGEGIIKVVGEVGSGKTMLCRMLQILLPETIETVYLANPSMAPDEVLHAIASELQLKLPKNADKFQVMQALQQHLLNKHEAGRQVVIFVEEAQGMPLSTLEEIRLLSNLETKRDKLLQIVLFGQPELDTNLNAPQIRQLKERITHSFSLGPLDQDAIGEYLIFRLRSAGYYGPHLFNKSAIAVLSKTAKGLVRRVNILADKALLAAFSENVYQVTPKHVRAAIQDSEFGNVQQNRTIGAHIAYAIGATLLIGLALGITLAHWLSPTHPSALVAETKTPVSSAPVREAHVETPVEPAVTLVKAKEPDAVAQSLGNEPAPVPAINTDILLQRLDATQAWLKDNPQSTVSLQLMGSANDEQVRSELQALSRQLDIEHLYVFRTRVGNVPFMTILYGSYPTRGEATAALHTLPDAVAVNKPQLRTVGGIMKEIKQFQ